ncbi:TM2 domain-containing protein [uncultured Helicobacter sp.]|uniref:TM2 domain-containing protein n=1 Tax=uncultured Helicobacter sp. TaxID=175537 RepID=UPI0025F0C378|nr:TM2 domain-containing protein [uncultured Helicobacter sp.]
MDNYAFMLAQQWVNKIPAEATLSLQQQLDKLPNDKISSLGFLPLKDPVIGLVLGLFLGHFGADRFYKGDIGLGILKIILGILGIVFFVVFILAGAVMSSNINGDSHFLVAFFLGLLALLAPSIWVIADWFFVWKGIKQDNFNKITECLSMLGAGDSSGIR